jgi:hypothetical protein
VVVLGAIMTIPDMTIVNVGLATLGRDFRPDPPRARTRSTGLSSGPSRPVQHHDTRPRLHRPA